MAAIDPNPPPKNSSRTPNLASAIFDIRVIGVIAQIIFVILAVIFFAWVGRNVNANLATLGENQFACADGSSSFRCSFRFMEDSAQFEIDENVINYETTDSYWRALAVGALNTVKVSAWGIPLTTVLGTLVGIALLSKNWFVRTVARSYVEIFRNTPLLVQLVLIFFVFFAALLPDLKDASRLFGLPIYFNKRGVDFATFAFMPNGAMLRTMLIVGAIVALIVLNRLSAYTNSTGKTTRAPFVALGVFLLFGLIGYFLSGNNPSTQGFIAQDIYNVSSFDDVLTADWATLKPAALEQVLANTAEGAEPALEIDLAENDAGVARLKICTLAGSPSLANVTERLESAGIEYDMSRAGTIARAERLFNSGECDVLAGETTTIIDRMGDVSLTPIKEPRAVWSIPRLDGLNFQGGAKMTSAFGAVLLGLVLNTGASVAEIVRAGIQAVSKGQSEAASALGLSESQRLSLVVLPQALQVIIPPLISSYLNLVKNSTLAMIVAYADWWAVTNTIINQSGRPIQPILITMLTFLTLSLSISGFLNWYNARVRIKER